jgi:hypothetical protein
MFFPLILWCDTTHFNYTHILVLNEITLKIATWLAEICYLIYFLNAIGLTPGGSSTVHIYAKTIHKTKQLTNLVGPTFVCLWRDSPQWTRAFSFTRFLDHTQRRPIVSRTPLDEWSVRRIDLYLTTHNTHNRQTSMLAGGIRTHNLSRRLAVDLHLTTRGHWDRLIQWKYTNKIK